MVAMAALVLLTVKMFDLWTGYRSGVLGIAPAVAASEAKPTADNKKPKEEEKKDGKKAEQPAPHEPGLGYADFSEIRDPALISESEVRVLESLAERRTQIDARERALAMKTSLLEATEKRVQKRIDELKTLEAKIKDLLGQLDGEAEAQISSLVKVYENMKAKDAARIFENLDQEILISVAARMREQKIAAILAQMRPETAQSLTVLLAKRYTDLETAMDG